MIPRRARHQAPQEVLWAKREHLPQDARADIYKTLAKRQLQKTYNRRPAARHAILHTLFKAPLALKEPVTCATT